MPFLLIVFFIASLDQLIKHVMVRLLEDGLIVLIPSYLDLELVYNTGAGFGILAGQRLFLIFFSCAAIALLLYYLLRHERYALALSAIVGGALGNLIDRIFRGAVVDYINFSFWPAFNLADSAITLGVIMIIGIMLAEEVRGYHARKRGDVADIQTDR